METLDVFVTSYGLHESRPVLFGLTADGQTVGVRVLNLPFVIYAEPPPGTGGQDEAAARRWMDGRVRPLLRRVSERVRPSVQLVPRRKLCGYQAEPCWMVRAVYDSAQDAREDGRALERRFSQARVYHHRLDPALVFAGYTGVRCFSWIKCQLPQRALHRVTTCALEYACDARRLRPAAFADGDPRAFPPPLRIASFDIETDGLKWDAGHELRMIAVACDGHDFLLTRHYLEATPPPAYHVVDCKDEADLVARFVDLVNELRPVFLTGWNIFGFDLQFVFERARALGVFHKIQELSWYKAKPVRPVMREMSSNAFGRNRVYHDDLEGLITLDGYILARKSLKMPSYSLKAFGEWVGQAKGDVTYEEMVEAFATRDPALMRRVADYCARDARIVLPILERMEEPDKVMAMTRLAAVPPVYAIKRGQSILTFGLIVSEVFQRGLVINPPPRPDADEKGDEEAAGYEGATVIDPMRGYHRDPVAVLDFESLYPSVMRAYNICFSTLVCILPPSAAAAYPWPEYAVVDIGPLGQAVFRRVEEGVLPSILTTLLAKRKEVKHAMTSLAPGTVEYNQANAKQLSLKVACNSVYGYLGASTAQLYQKALAASVTSMGRHSLHRVRDLIRELAEAGEVPPQTHVVYGDSVVGDTPLLVRTEGRRVSVQRIDELEGSWNPYHGTKEAFVPSRKLEVWQDGGFAEVQLVIRHKTLKPIVRVRTGAGLVDCTKDHSLVGFDGRKLKADDVGQGTALLHTTDHELARALAAALPPRILAEAEAFEMGLWATPATVPPPEVLAGPLGVVRAYWEGLGHDSQTRYASKAALHGAYLLAVRLGMHAAKVGAEAGGFTLSAKEPGPWAGSAAAMATLVVETRELVFDARSVYVYDLTTASGHFACGPGRLVVHNTDSVMVKFPGMAPPDAHSVGTFLEERCTAIFPPPMRLEYENLFVTYLLMCKKRYGAKTWTEGGPGKILVKGLSVVRRDFPSIVRNGIKGVLDILLEGDEDDPPTAALAYLESTLHRIAVNAVSFDELSITKELAKTSYAVPPPHLVVADRMRKRKPHDPPKPGDRITFVVLHGKGKVSERAEEFEFVRDHMPGAKADLEYYADQLAGQCEPMMQLCGKGIEFESVSKKWVTAARLHAEGQPKLSRFFATTTESKASGATKRAEKQEQAGPERKAKKQASLGQWMSKSK
jgi:DNA polymerase elongation subunit (family B)